MNDDDTNVSDGDDDNDENNFDDNLLPLGHRPRRKVRHGDGATVRGPTAGQAGLHRADVRRPQPPAHTGATRGGLERGPGGRGPGGNK